MRSTAKPSLERSFQSRVIKDLKRVEGLYFFKKEAAAIRGLPDIVICYRGKFVAWELKRDARAKPSVLQSYNVNRITACGGIALVVHPENYREVFFKLTGIELRL